MAPVPVVGASSSKQLHRIDHDADGEPACLFSVLERARLNFDPLNLHLVKITNRRDAEGVGLDEGHTVYSHLSHTNSPANTTGAHLMILLNWYSTSTVIEVLKVSRKSTIVQWL